MAKMWTCAKCGGNEYSTEGRLRHVCYSWVKKTEDKRAESKKSIERAEIIEENPQELTQKKGVKRGRKSKKSNNNIN